MRKNKSIEGSTKETFKKRSISNTDVLKENVDGWNRHFNKEYQRWYWKADVMIRVDHLTTQLSSLVEERESTITSTRQLESKVNKVYKTNPRRG